MKRILFAAIVLTFFSIVGACTNHVLQTVRTHAETRIANIERQTGVEMAQLRVKCRASNGIGSEC